MKRSTSPSRLRIRLPTAPAGLARRARLPSRSRSASSMRARGARGSFLPQTLRQHLVPAVWRAAALGKAGVMDGEDVVQTHKLDLIAGAGRQRQLLGTDGTSEHAPYGPARTTATH